MKKTHFARALIALVFIALQPAYADAPTDTLARIQTEKTIRIGLREKNPPFGYFEADKPAGLSWELCSAIVKQMEVTLKTKLKIIVTPVTLASSFEGLKNGDIDLQCGSTTHTKEREEKVDFSYTFFVSGLTTAYRNDDISFANPLQFGRVAALTGSTALKIIEARFARKGAANITAVVPVKSYEEALDKLKKKEVDTMFADLVLMPIDPSISVRRSLETIEPYALMMRKGDKQFSDMIDRSMIAVFATGAMKNFTKGSKFEGRINFLTLESWRNPSKEASLSLY